MSLHPQAVYLVPEETARVAHAAFPKGNVYMQMYDELGLIYENHQFATLFPRRGQPAEDPARLALILVMQFAENLTDRQTADAVRGRIDWKYALGLELTDPGFDFSVLSEFRSRLVTGAAEHLLLDTLLTQCKARGLLKARGRQRTDSLAVVAAIRSLNRLELVGETLRHTLERLAAVAPAWLRTVVAPDWFERYGKRFDTYRLPKTEVEREALAATIGADGVHLLRAIDAPEAPPAAGDEPAVTLLRDVWRQQHTEPPDDPGSPVPWRKVADLPPPSELIPSPYDPEARYGTKRETNWVGYKVHITETCDPDAPHLITNVETTPATTSDFVMLPTIHEHLADREITPCEHLVDSGYMTAEHVVTSQEDGIDLLGPVTVDRSWQAKAGEGFDAACFQIDWERQRVTCPQGHQSTRWKPWRDTRGKAIIQVAFAEADCLACPVRAQCTRSPTRPREISFRPQAEYEALHQARTRQASAAFKEQYAQRAGIEGTFAQGLARCDLRQARYIGQAKTALQHILTAVALNLVRIIAWWRETPRITTRKSHFAALAPTG